jgi:crotonobetainyl-CoA:carnitine CoA-transferase CaiB-like acyl-CoA transferase
VLDASTILAGPLAAQILGDYGADVIKIEHPRNGDGMRGHGPARDGVPLWWAELSRNKRTIGLDLGVPAGAEVFKQLAATADVIIENFRPGTLERWGLGWDVLRDVNPKLILARITGWGQEGPYAERPGFGTLAEAMSGFAHLTGQPDGPPTLPAFGLADSICGASAVGLITMALYHRDANGGEGQQVDLSIIEPMVMAVGPGPTVYDQLGTESTRTGNRSVNNAPRNLYRCADDHWVAVSTSATSVAERVLRLIGHPEVIDEPWFASGQGRVQHADMLDGWVAQWIGERTADEVMTAFTEASAAVAPVYTARDVLNDPHLNATGMITTVDDEVLGPVRMHGVLGRMSATPGEIRFTGRPLGRDTDECLRSVGYAADAIEDLRGSGVIA